MSVSMGQHERFPFRNKPSTLTPKGPTLGRAACLLRPGARQNPPSRSGSVPAGQERPSACRGFIRQTGFGTFAEIRSRVVAGRTSRRGRLATRPVARRQALPRQLPRCLAAAASSCRPQRPRLSSGRMDAHKTKRKARRLHHPEPLRHSLEVRYIPVLRHVDRDPPRYHLPGLTGSCTSQDRCTFGRRRSMGNAPNRPRPPPNPCRLLDRTSPLLLSRAAPVPTPPVDDDGLPRAGPSIVTDAPGYHRGTGRSGAQDHLYYSLSRSHGIAPSNTPPVVTARYHSTAKWLPRVAPTTVWTFVQPQQDRHRLPRDKLTRPSDTQRDFQVRQASGGPGGPRPDPPPDERKSVGGNPERESHATAPTRPGPRRCVSGNARDFLGAARDDLIARSSRQKQRALRSGLATASHPRPWRLPHTRAQGPFAKSICLGGIRKYRTAVAAVEAAPRPSHRIGTRAEDNGVPSRVTRE